MSIQEEEGIFTITISREKALNALNTQTMMELKHFFGEEGLQKISEIKGVILTGAGEKSLVAGADIKEYLSIDEVAGGQEMA